MKITNSSTFLTLFTLVVLVMPITKAHAKSRGGGEADAHKKKGIELMDARHFDAAAEEFGKAIAADPKDPRLYHNRAIAYFSGGQAAEANQDTAGAQTRYTSAINDFSKEIELAPKEEGGYVGRGQAEVLLHQNDAAIGDLNKALELKPDDPLAFKFRGFADIGNAQWDKAVADFSAAIQKNPDDTQSYERRAWAYRNLQNYNAAIDDYSSVLTKNPNDADTLAKRGYTYNLTQQYEKAIPDFEQALKLNPNDVDTPQRLQYSRSMLAARNAPPPTEAAPTPTPAPGLLTPVNILIGTAVLIVLIIVLRLLTRGKAEPTSGRIR
jgi:tetratricopeptide (TPR) repeat protein